MLATFSVRNYRNDPISPHCSHSPTIVGNFLFGNCLDNFSRDGKANSSYGARPASNARQKPEWVF